MNRPFLVGFWISVILALVFPSHLTRSLNLAFMVVGMGILGLELYRSHRDNRKGRK